jgi:histone H3/H4
MKFKTLGVIGLITLIVVTIGATAFTNIEKEWFGNRAPKQEIAKITNKIVVEYSDYESNEKLFDTYAITKTNGLDDRQYIGIKLLSSIRREQDVLNENDRGIESTTIKRIMLTFLEKRPIVYEGSMENEREVVEYYLKEYSNDFTTFCITRNNKNIIKFTGKKEIAWKLIEKIRDISMQAKQELYQNSKATFAEVNRIHVHTGIKDAQSNKARAENLQISKEEIGRKS